LWFLHLLVKVSLLPPCISREPTGGGGFSFPSQLRKLGRGPQTISWFILLSFCFIVFFSILSLLYAFPPFTLPYVDSSLLPRLFLIHRIRWRKHLLLHHLEPFQMYRIIIILIINMLGCYICHNWWTDIDTLLLTL
jgi:hypothetical protein